MRVDIGSGSFVWHQWVLIRISTNFPDSFKFPIALFSYCLTMMMLIIELYWTYASYCILMHIFLTQTRLHNTYKRTPNVYFHYWVVSHSSVSFYLALIRVSHGYGFTRGASKMGVTGTGTVLIFGTPWHTMLISLLLVWTCTRPFSLFFLPLLMCRAKLCSLN